MDKKTKFVSLTVCIVALALFATCLLTSCCSQTKKITNIRVASYPDKVVYVIGLDTELDLSGGIFVVDYKKGQSAIHKMRPGYYIGGCELTHNIDLKKEGIYLITFSAGDVERFFPIQVISIESLRQLAKDGQQKADYDPFADIE